MAANVGTELSSPERGLEYAIAGLLQSPHFLYRAELGSGADVAPGLRAYSDHELATRISYLVWNSTPDDVLLDAADAGQLTSAQGTLTQLERLLADERARAGLEELFADFLEARGIANLEKLSAAWTPSLARTLQLQLVKTATAAVAGGDYRQLFTSQTVFINDELAPLYQLPATYGNELVPITLPATHVRSGLLSLPGVLALHSYPGKTSPALRGLFVRKKLLCQEIPPPPAGVDTTLPMGAPGELVTTRDLVARHQTEKTCIACHALMDPVGLALEHFDATGGYRDNQNGLAIDPSGALDGVPFQDARGLGVALAAHPSIGTCFVENLYAVAAGRTLSAEEAAALEPVLSEFAGSNYSIQAAFRALVGSDAFRLTRTEVL